MVVALAASVVLSAQDPQQPPVFRSRVEVVQLDVTVLDRNRRPVRGLIADDFTVLEDGKPQPVVAFTSFDVDENPAPTVGWMRDVPPDVTSNELKDSRLFVLVMDDAMIPQDPRFAQDTKKIVASIIDKLGPEDLTAVVFTGDNRKSQDFTHDKDKLKAAVEGFNPGLTAYRFGGDSGGVDVDLHFYMSSIRTLSDVADFLIAVPNRRKALLWVSPGIPLDPNDATPHRAPLPGEAGPPAAAALDMRDIQDRTQEIFLRAQRANVAIYPIDPTGLDGLMTYVLSRGVSIMALGDRPDPERLRQKVTAMHDFLVMAAANTGGRTVMNTNDFERGITEVFAENSAYYLIGFEPTNTADDGKLRRVEVKVNRPDVEVRTRTGYFAPKAEGIRAKATLSPEVAALGNAIGGILPATDLPMRVATAPFAVPGQRLATVTVVLGVRQPIPPEAATERITETTELQTSAFTPEGSPKGTQRHTAKVVLRAGSNGEAAYEVLGRIDLAPGRYRLRLAAHNATSSKSGSVFADVEVPDYSNAPFTTAPVVLGATPGRVSAPSDLFAGLLPFVPTAEREFTDSTTVTALLRLYQSGRKPVEPVEVTIAIRDEDDRVNATETRTLAVNDFPAVGQQPDPSASSAGLPVTGVRTSRGISPQQSQATDKFANPGLRVADVTYQLPLADLEPGPHLLTFEARLGSTVLRRDVRFVVR